jgi:hypothetical protein
MAFTCRKASFKASAARAMLSVTWEFPKESRTDFINKVRAFIGPCEGLA